MNSKTPLLEISHLSKDFEGKDVLKDITFSLNEGEIFCLIGQSGHGKSVVLKTLMGLLRPSSGTISFNGTPIAGDGAPVGAYEDYRSKFGLLFQGAALFDSLSVGENISFSLRENSSLTPSEIDDIVQRNLAMVGLEGQQHLYPSELSGGMKSRVGLARAVALQPQIMLYDEPTSALDPIMSDHIGSLIEELRSTLHMTSVVVTHDVSLAYKIADTIAMIYKGEIIFLGTPGEIKQIKDPYIQQFLQGEKLLHSALMKSQ